jgi:phosphatidate phosphatase APP1
MKFLFNDERRNAAITLKVNGENYKAISDAEGYFSFELFYTLPSLATNCKIELYLDAQPNIKAKCNPYILDDKTRLGIISDFDDTVIVSNVTSKLGLFVQLFLKNYKQREAIHGMAKLFKLLLAKDTNKKDAPLFFISASPRQLHRSIKKFLQLHAFPKHTIITKKIHGKGADKIFSHKTYKKRQILKLIKLYPTVKWILFGDSGEHDKAIYKSIKDEFPNHIDSIYIRDVRSGDIKEIAL